MTAPRLPEYSPRAAVWIVVVFVVVIVAIAIAFGGAV